jgi:succinate-semialdehyde dehydrogenase/glutarate-semialdehyde dehydrogenase
MSMKSINPATGRTIAEYKEHSDKEIDAALERATNAFKAVAPRDFAARAANMRAAADILDAERETFAALMTAEMGKTIASARAEAEKCAGACRYFAEHAEQFLADEALPSDHARAFARHLPLGPVLAIMPWNFPFWQVIRFAAPALMAGNVGLLKHASNVTGCALALEDIFRRAGFGDAFQTLKISPKKVAQVIEDRRIKAVTITGSEGAGRSVAATAGGAIKRTVLELGGSDAFIVMPSADFDLAVETGVKARIINNGQSCIAAKRFIIHDDIYDAYRDAFIARLKTLKVGDPMQEDTDIGPLVSAKAREDLHAQVFDSVGDGAKRTFGAEPIGADGAYYQPGLLEDIPFSSPAYKEELFGPVAVFFRAASFDRAIEIANDHRYGLGSAIWTNDEGEMQAAADRLEAGATFVNAMVASDSRLPFGGVKASGYGRELARDGMLEFVNRKTVAIGAQGAQGRDDIE